MAALKTNNGNFFVVQEINLFKKLYFQANRVERKKKNKACKRHENERKKIKDLKRQRLYIMCKYLECVYNQTFGPY